MGPDREEKILRAALIAFLSVSVAAISMAQQSDSPVGVSESKAAASEYAALLKQAGEFRLQGGQVEAEKIYDGLVQRNPRDVDALIGRGFCRLRDDSALDSALADFNKVIVLTPSSGDAYLGAAICYKRMKDEAKLESVISAAESAAGTDEAKRKKMAQSAWTAGMPELARRLDKTYEEMLTEDEKARQEYVALLAKAGELRRTGKSAEASAIYEELLLRNNKDVDALVGRGFCRLKDDADLNAALSDFTTVMSASPLYADAFIGAAICYKRMKDTVRMDEIIQRVAQSAAGDEERKQKVAQSAWTAGLPELARKLDAKFSSMSTEDEKVRQEYVAMLAKAGELRRTGYFVEALKIYDDMVLKNRNDVDAIVGRGFCLLKDDSSIGAAVADFEKVMILSPSYADAYLGAAICYKRMKDPVNMEKVLAKAEATVAGDEAKRKKLAESAWVGGMPELARRLDKSYEEKVTPDEQARKEHVDLLTRARDLRLDGKTADAQKIYDSLILKNTNDVDAICGLAFCFLRDSSTLDEALALFQRTYTLSPDYMDAYMGAAACFRRKADFRSLKAELEKAEKVCAGNEKRTKYLAATAWREGHYQMGRRLDRIAKPDDDRVLISDPSQIELQYGHSWLERGEDWDELQLSYSRRLRPDIGLNAELDNWWRYGDFDWSALIGGSYRHNYRWAGSYNFEYSDVKGFLARQKHKPTIYYKMLRRMTVFAGPRFDNYGGDWAEKLKVGFSQYAANWFVEGTYTFGNDSKSQDVASWSATAGYSRELRYALAAGFGSGDETVEYFRNENVLYRTENVESMFIRGTYYVTETFGLTSGWMHELRESDLFRRELTLGVFKNW